MLTLDEVSFYMNKARSFTDEEVETFIKIVQEKYPNEDIGLLRITLNKIRGIEND